ncbi:MAG: lytic murein transglycosylase, partial [Rhodospirillaceae bacterium]|nr:lytic murein transglycosylase [Rhodospirillaceae bacterium]
RMKGSWAGAMGHFQFIPTTFNAYAVDFDGDGKRDIWTNKKDAFASAANFLSNSGWKGDEIWGREVKVGSDFDFTNASLKIKKPLAGWQALGVRRIDGRNLPRADVVASLLAPAGHAGPKFLVYGNFRATMRWNQSQFYALAIGHLADRIVGKGPLSTLGPRDAKSLSFVQSEQLQQLLIDAGYDPGPADGIIGSKTKDAIRSYQKDRGMVPDGHPSLEILSHIKGQ